MGCEGAIEGAMVGAAVGATVGEMSPIAGVDNTASAKVIPSAARRAVLKVPPETAVVMVVRRVSDESGPEDDLTITWYTTVTPLARRERRVVGAMVITNTSRSAAPVTDAMAAVRAVLPAFELTMSNDTPTIDWTTSTLAIHPKMVGDEVGTDEYKLGSKQMTGTMSG